MTPSMSVGDSPASAMASSEACIWSATTLLQELRLYAVSPIPVIAPRALRAMILPSFARQPGPEGRRPGALVCERDIARRSQACQMRRRLAQDSFLTVLGRAA